MHFIVVTPKAVACLPEQEGEVAAQWLQEIHHVTHPNAKEDVVVDTMMQIGFNSCHYSETEDGTSSVASVHLLLGMEGNELPRNLFIYIRDFDRLVMNDTVELLGSSGVIDPQDYSPVAMLLTHFAQNTVEAVDIMPGIFYEMLPPEDDPTKPHGIIIGIPLVSLHAVKHLFEELGAITGDQVIAPGQTH